MSYQTVQPASLDFNGLSVTSFLNDHYYPWFSCDPSKPLIGSAMDNQWYSDNNDNKNVSFIMRYNSPFIAKKIYYHNSHSFGKQTASGWRSVSLWGSNFNIPPTYDNYDSQTLIWEGDFNIHTSEDIEDPQYVIISNNTPYQYYFFRIAQPWITGLFSFIGIRYIALQEEV